MKRLIKYMIFCMLLAMFTCEEQPQKQLPTVTKDEMKSSMEKANRYLMNEEEEDIANYIQRHGLEMTATGTGLRYQIIKPGSGASLAKGQKVTLEYELHSIAGDLLYSSEKDGLKALLETKTIGVPKVHSFGKYERKSFLLMDYLQPAKQDKRFWENFGHALAEIHKADTTALLDSNESDIKKYGFYRNNYIGAGHQKNTPKETWIGFFRDCRIMPQLKRAEKKLPSSDIKKIEHIMDDLDRYLIEPEKPSLLHGDLWSGNFVAGPDGNAWLIDPAVYVGCSEADIAMTELFGGFSGTFYGAYRESGLIMPGYEERRDLYNLYHMLNHLNLFGSSYLYAVERIISGY